MSTGSEDRKALPCWINAVPWLTAHRQECLCYPESLLPDAADFFFGLDHGLAGFARERFSEFGHVHDYAVDAVLGWRMRVDLGAQA
jgi:hypothetical protein